MSAARSKRNAAPSEPGEADPQIPPSPLRQRGAEGDLDRSRPRRIARLVFFRWSEAAYMWRTIRTVVGMALLGLGLVGMVLPVLPGIPFLLAGVALLGTNHPWVRPFMARLRLWRRKRTRAANRKTSNRSDHRHGGVPGR